MAGTPLMQAERTVGIDLPQKVLVWVDDAGTHVTYNDPAYLAERHGITGQQQNLEMISGLLASIAG